ncbi:unnamed protein product [Ceratitis capitata]|uniref:(Mediterranean fruit fly) hypothetical protein n=1 Tax=Ceratitis capitata TaxID=7213 RepID=A0A811UYQ7_CERCA|nr:unnamed protein product [Ceratitis capitata]
MLEAPELQPSRRFVEQSTRNDQIGPPSLVAERRLHLVALVAIIHFCGHLCRALWELKQLHIVFLSFS